MQIPITLSQPLSFHSDLAPARLPTLLSSEPAHVAKATAGCLAGVRGLPAGLKVPVTCPAPALGFLGEPLSWRGMRNPDEESTG